MNTLIDELVKLVQTCNNSDIDITICGGLGLFIRDVFLKPTRSPRYAIPIEARTTTDIDCLTSKEMISSASHMNILSEIIKDTLGYTPIVKFMQFEKGFGATKVKIDLISPEPQDLSKVKIQKPRIRPKGAKDIHAFLAPEAATIHVNRRDVVVSGVCVKTPSSINFLILKLHAIRDRQQDEKTDLGRHHALDVFRIVAAMDQRDWFDARDFMENYGAYAHVQEAQQIVQSMFSKKTAIGCIRLREHPLFDERQSLYLDHFIDDLNEIFKVAQ